MINFRPLRQTTVSPNSENQYTKIDNPVEEATSVTLYNNSSVTTTKTEITIKNTVQEEDSNCITVLDLYCKVKTYCDKIFFTSISEAQFVEMANQSLKIFWSLKPTKWNFTLSDKLEIDISNQSCKYPLPKDYYGLSIVGVSQASECLQTKQVFSVIPFPQFDTSPVGYYVSIKQDYDRDYLYWKIPGINIDNFCNNNFDNSLNKTIKGKFYIRYYTRPPLVKHMSDTICKLPIRWGGGDILVQLIAQLAHASKGKAYQTQANFNVILSELKKLDEGLLPRNPIFNHQPANFRIIRNF